MALQTTSAASAPIISPEPGPRNDTGVSPVRTAWVGGIATLMSRWWFAYPTLWLLQLKVIWGDWNYRDLSFGDTTSYFINAAKWYYDFSVDIMWSPLYTAFYGSLLYLSPDAYVVTELHRLIIVFAGVTLFLAVMRRLLPHGVAWLVAAWWAVLRTNYDVMYEVHLFSVLPVLAAFAVILTGTGPWSRGAALAILLVAALLARNELTVAFGALALACAAWELWSAVRRGSKGQGTRWSGLRRAIPAYGLPLLLASTTFLVFYSRSFVDPPRMRERSVEKHTINLCQLYAHGYQERYPGAWTNSPWTQCYDLMNEHFGKREPTFGETLWRNPGAALEHVAWNLTLAPAGVQASLFNAIASTNSPDFVSIPHEPVLVTVLSVAAILLILVGGVLLFRERSFWWNSWLRARVWGWLALGAVASVSLLIIPVVRPRPEYLYGFTIFSMAAVGMGFTIAVQRWFGLARFQALMPAVVIATLVLVPGHYANLEHVKERTFLTDYQRLRPFFPLIARPDTLFLKGGFTELENYVAGLQLITPGSELPIPQGEPGRSLPYNILSERRPGEPLEAFLERRGITLVYMDHTLLGTLERDLMARTLLTTPDSVGWKVIGAQEAPATRWRLFHKIGSSDVSERSGQEAGTGAALSPPTPPPTRIEAFPADLRLPGLLYSGVYDDGWVGEFASVELSAPNSATALVIRGMVPQVGDAPFSSELRVLLDGQEVARRALTLGEFDVQVPIAEGPDRRGIELRFSNVQQLPGFERQVAALLRSVGFETVALQPTEPPPTRIEAFPADLRLPGLLYSGVYDDGWVGEFASVELSAPNSATALVIRGMVPQVGDAPFSSELRVLLDGQEVARRALTLGEFDVQVPIAEGPDRRGIELRFSNVQQLPGFERQVAALLRSVGFETVASQPTDPLGPGDQAAADIAADGAGLRLGAGWFPLETYAGETFRWVGNDAEVVVERTDARALTFEVEPGPGVGSKPFTLRVLDGAGAEIMAAEVRGRQRIEIPLPAGLGGSAIFRLHADGGGLPTPSDPRTLNFRVFKLELTGSAASYDAAALATLNAIPDIAPTEFRQALDRGEIPTDGLFVGEGWYPFESLNGETFRWVANDAEIVVTAPSAAREIDLEIEPGPGLGLQPFELQLLDQQGHVVARAQVRGREAVKVALPTTAGQQAVFRLHADGGGLPTPNDSRTLNFRVFRLDWAAE